MLFKLALRHIHIHIQVVLLVEGTPIQLRIHAHVHVHVHVHVHIQHGAFQAAVLSEPKSFGVLLAAEGSNAGVLCASCIPGVTLSRLPSGVCNKGSVSYQCMCVDCWNLLATYTMAHMSPGATKRDGS